MKSKGCEWKCLTGSVCAHLHDFESTYSLRSGRVVMFECNHYHLKDDEDGILKGRVKFSQIDLHQMPLFM